MALDAAAWAEAEHLESVAQQLELVHAAVCERMDTWEQWSAHLHTQGDGADTRDVVAADELRRRISSAYSFLQHEAAADSVPAAAEHLKGIDALIQRHVGLGELKTRVGEEKAAPASKTGATTGR